MKKFFRLSLIAFSIFFCSQPAFSIVKGEKIAGVRAGYASRNTSMEVGLYFQYSFSDHFRLQPSADFILRHRDRDAFLLDVNGQIPIEFSTDKFSLYPYAGLNFSSWNYHYKMLTPIVPENPDDPDLNPAPGELPGFKTTDGSKRYNRFGINVGAGFDLKVSASWKLSVEAGYTFIKANSGLRVLAGVGYIF